MQEDCLRNQVIAERLSPSFTTVLLTMGGRQSKNKERASYTFETQTDRITGQLFGAFTSGFVHQKEKPSKRWSQRMNGWMRQVITGKPMLPPAPPPSAAPRLLENRPAQEQSTSPLPPQSPGGHMIYPVRYHLGHENNPLHKGVGASSTAIKQPPLRPIDLRLLQGDLLSYLRTYLVTYLLPLFLISPSLLT